MQREIENFNKGIEEIKNIRMSEAEKAHMLKKIFASPIKSPYQKYSRVFVFARTHMVGSVFAVLLLVVVSGSGVVFASGGTLPGDILYPIKTKIVEPMLGVFQTSPEQKAAWAEKAVNARIDEAETLAEQGKLDDASVQELAQNIEKHSTDFGDAVNAVASSTASTTPSAGEKAQKLKQDFRDRINNRKEIVNKSESIQSQSAPEIKVESIAQPQTNSEDNSSSGQKIKKLRDTAMRALENRGRGENKKDR